jgi:ketosteroid isomerase-like protein
MIAFKANLLSAALVAALSLSLSASYSAFADDHAHDAQVSEAIGAVLNAQAAAWNRGDLDSFLTGYKKSPDISYVTADSEVWGYNALRDRYVKRYGDNHETMGTLSFIDLKVSPLGARNALCLGHWQLERKDKPQAGGIFSLIFERSDKGWKIIHDHTSAKTK